MTGKIAESDALSATMTTWRMMSFLLLYLLGLKALPVKSFEWSTGGRFPELDRYALSGLWRLTPRNYPIKEFTVHPKRPTEEEPEVLLMLKEDGSFLQYKQSAETEETGDVDVDASWSKFRQKRKKREEKPHDSTLEEELVKGTWDFVDGKLILAADRLSGEKRKDNHPLTERMGDKKHPDTLLVGRVVATYANSLEENPVLKSEANVTAVARDNASGTKPATASQQTAADALDAHLSVPKGSVKVGRFFYPKKHPSFFEQPMFQPMLSGAFSLKQVLGNLNAKNREREERQEKYRPRDFYNKTFLLTSHPLQPRRPKGNKRWSIKYNKYVEDPPNKEAARAAEEERNRAVPIRVMQVAFHANNTFSTVAGLGEAILRGKFDVIGHEKDQLWMQVWRFGFGRSVSGSVYSEGKSLTHEDAKTYWGTIGPETRDDVEKDRTTEKADQDITPKALDDQEGDKAKQSSGDEAEKSQRLEVRGSVMFGWGLEPMPVARFIMRETQVDDAVDLDEEEDEEDDESGLDISSMDNAFSQDGLADKDGIDWSGPDDRSFQ